MSRHLPNRREGALSARRGVADSARVTVSGPKEALVGVVLRPAVAGRLAAAGTIQMDGDEAALREYAGVLDEFDPNFPIVMP